MRFIASCLAVTFTAALIAHAGPTPTPTDKEQAVRATVAEMANRVYSSRGLDAILEMVAKSDRERIGKTLDNEEHKQFVASADEVARLFREKYGHNFDAVANIESFKNLKVTMSKDDQGRDRATISFPSMGGRSRFDVRLVHEGTSDWRIVLPESVTPNNFAGRMHKSLQLVIDQAQRGKWPENRSEAYQYITAQALHTLASETDRTAIGE